MLLKVAKLYPETPQTFLYIYYYFYLLLLYGNGFTTNNIYNRLHVCVCKAKV